MNNPEEMTPSGNMTMAAFTAQAACRLATYDAGVAARNAASERTERSYPYNLVNIETGAILETRLRSPNEAADLNAGRRDRSSRWLPV